MAHDFDWSTRSPPWNTLGPKIAAELRRVAAMSSNRGIALARKQHRRFSGERLRIIRQQAEMTQTELAEASGYDVDQIGTWERGEHMPREMTVVDLAQALSVDPRDFDA